MELINTYLLKEILQNEKRNNRSIVSVDVFIINYNQDVHKAVNKLMQNDRMKVKDILHKDDKKDDKKDDSEEKKDDDDDDIDNNESTNKEKQ